MTSSLYGIYNTQRALQMNQAAINLVNTNITNMNTEGYSKQRLEVSQNVKTGKADGAIASSQAGLGPSIDGITRNRDVYLDSYYRKENTKLSYYSELQNNNLILEDITNELSGSGVNKVLGDFYDSANQLSANPTDSVARTDFAQKSESVALKLNQLYEQLNSYSSSISGDTSNAAAFNESKIGTEVTSLNTKLQNLADVNNTIMISSSQNITPNGLLDQRDKLIDEISKSLPITIKQNAGNTVTVSLGGNDLVAGSKFMTKLTYETEDTTKSSSDSNPPVIKLQQVEAPGNVFIQNVNSLITSGKLGALVELTSKDTTKLNNITGILDQLNTLAKNFAKEVNSIQLSSDDDLNTISLSMDRSTTPPKLVEATESMFTSSVSSIALQINSSPPDYSNLTAGNIKINSNILSDPFKIAASKLKLDTPDKDSAVFNTAKTAFDTTKTAFDTAKTIYDAIAPAVPTSIEQGAYDTATANYNTATANYNAAKTTNAVAADTYKTAKTIYDAAKTTYDAMSTPTETDTLTFDAAKDAFKEAAKTYKPIFLSRNNNQTGDGSNAMLLAQLRNKAISGTGGLNGSTSEQYVNTIVGKFGVQAGTVQDKLDSQASIMDQIKAKRETAIGVNLDEELTDLVKYQRAYEASSRVFNVVNQMLQEMMNLGR